MRQRWWAVAVASALVLTTASAKSNAQEAAAPSAPSAAAQRAEALMAEGMRERDAHRDARALVLFREAFALYPSTATRARLGLAAGNVGRWVEAAEAMSEALRDAGPGVARDAFLTSERAEALRGALTQALAHVGVVQLEGGPDDARVTVNGAPRGALGALRRLFVEPGVSALSIEAPGYEPWEARVELRALDVQRRPVAMARLREGAAAVVPVAVSSVAPVPLRTAGASPMRPVGWALFGVGAAGLASGVATTVLWQQSVGRLASTGCMISGAAVSGPESCVGEARFAQTTRGAAIAGYAAGGALVAAGLALVALAPASGRAESSTGAALRCVPELGAWAMRCGASF